MKTVQVLAASRVYDTRDYKPKEDWSGFMINVNCATMDKHYIDGAVTVIVKADSLDEAVDKVMKKRRSIEDFHSIDKNFSMAAQHVNGNGRPIPSIKEHLQKYGRAPGYIID